MLKNRLLLTAAAAALVLGFANGALAASLDVGAVLDAKQAISLSNATNMNFGVVEFTAAHSGTIQLATNGTASLSGGAAGLVLAGTAAAGSVTIASDGTSAMQISCDTGGTLVDGENDTLTLTATEIAVGVGAAFGAGTACAGVGTNPLVNTGATIVRVGGSIAVNNSLTNGDYSTANGAGVPVTVDVVYQ